MENVKLIRLLSGEELLAEVLASAPKLFLTSTTTQADVTLDENSGPITVKNPIMLVTSEVDGQVRTQMAPWIAYKGKDAVIVIRENAIVFVAEADERLVAQYNKIFSKIITPSQGLIIPGR